MIQKESYFEHHKSVIFVPLFTQSFATFKLVLKISETILKLKTIKCTNCKYSSQANFLDGLQKIKLICDDYSANWSYRITYDRVT